MYKLIGLRAQSQHLQHMNSQSMRPLSSSSLYILCNIFFKHLLIPSLKHNVLCQEVLDDLDRLMVEPTKGRGLILVMVILTTTSELAPTIILFNLHRLLWDRLSIVSGLHSYHLCLYLLLLRVSNPMLLRVNNTRYKVLLEENNVILLLNHICKILLLSHLQTLLIHPWSEVHYLCLIIEL